MLDLANLLILILKLELPTNKVKEAPEAHQAVDLDVVKHHNAAVNVV